MNDRGRAVKAAIRNRDIPKLRNVLYMMQEVKRLEAAGERQLDRKEAITRVFSGLPGGGGGVPHGFDEILARLDEIGGMYAQQLNGALDALQEAQALLNDIADARLRTFVWMLYVADMSPREVREELNLSTWRFRQMREAVEQAECMKMVKLDGF